jgi:hypothetical protein
VNGYFFSADGHERDMRIENQHRFVDKIGASERTIAPHNPTAVKEPAFTMNGQSKV